MAKILGLDLGTNSIGWAITKQSDNSFTLLNRGVDIFQEGVNRTKSGEEPMVKIRTDARALRRHYYRRRLRKISLLKILVENDFCPYLSDEQFDDWRYHKRYPMSEEFLLWQRTDDNKDKNPYHDRYIALTTELDLSKRSDRHLLGRALYHLSQRRGFLSNRKDQDDKDSGTVKSAIGELSLSMEQYDCQYIGEYFFRLYQEGKTIRKHYTSRKEHFEKEFDAICQKQNLSPELKKALWRAIFFQRPLKSQKGLVGSCTFEKGKARCPISHPRFEEFRMWSFINNIKVRRPQDNEYRELCHEEIEMIIPLFYRKSKPHFDFEDIAKAIAGKKKGMYAYQGDSYDAHYKFNYRMSHSVAGCPITAALRSCFGDDWVTEVRATYLKGFSKSENEVINDIWHVLFSFDDTEKLQLWAEKNLQLTTEDAKKFAAIRTPNDYASLSLNAINKILPYLRDGYRYDQAVFLANLAAVVPSNVWSDDAMRENICKQVADVVSDCASHASRTKEKQIFDCLLDCGLSADQIKENRLYHPSMIETYQDAKPNSSGVLQLGSPRTSSVRNPMAMRALFRLRALVNQLLKDGQIDEHTKVNIEFSRNLNDANMRKALERYQRENEKTRQEIVADIRALFKEETGRDIEPSEDEILKYQLWKEQNSTCLYTGNNIGISEFIGANPKYDIEHTVPRSRGGDNSQMNKTLCQCDFNRRIKKGKLPTELANYAEIKARLDQLGWQEEIEKLEKQRAGCKRSSSNATSKEAKDKARQEFHYLTMRRDYLRGKLERFTMTEVTDGFRNRQGVDIGIIGKYAKMYLETVFERVYTVKGATTSDFRKAWGLQEEYSKKSRANHVHHCIDAITIACIGSGTYAKWAQFQQDTERENDHKDQRPIFDKPWATFTEDVKAIAAELLVSHHTANNLPKHSRKKLRVRGKVQLNADGKPIYVQGDTARGSLHQQTFYGAIKRDDQVKYVVRKALDALQPSDVDKIVDDAVRECVKAAIAREGFKTAMSKPICFNKAKGIYIKKVRIFTPSITAPIHLKRHRDLSRFDYKQEYHVANDGNYCMAIYEGADAKGRIKRSFKIVNNLEAAKFYNGKTNCYDIVPQSDANDYPLKCILRTGTMVLFYEHSADELYDCSKAEIAKRLYKVVKMQKDGRITFKYHQEAQNDENLKLNFEKLYGEKAPKALTDGYSKVNFDNPHPKLLISTGNLNIIVDGYDFELTVTGEIKFKH